MKTIIKYTTTSQMALHHTKRLQATMNWLLLRKNNEHNTKTEGWSQCNRKLRISKNIEHDTETGMATTKTTSNQDSSRETHIEMNKNININTASWRTIRNAKNIEQ